MPKHKPEKKNEIIDSDSDEAPPTKKSKTDSDTSTEEQNSWNLGSSRFIKLTEFKNKWYIDIREFYNNNGTMKPGRKGIMLTMDQWQKFKGCMDEIDDAIKKNV